MDCSGRMWTPVRSLRTTRGGFNHSITRKRRGVWVSVSPLGGGPPGFWSLGDLDLDVVENLGGCDGAPLVGPAVMGVSAGFGGCIGQRTRWG